MSNLKDYKGSSKIRTNKLEYWTKSCNKMKKRSERWTGKLKILKNKTLLAKFRCLRNSWMILRRNVQESKRLIRRLCNNWNIRMFKIKHSRNIKPNARLWSVKCNSWFLSVTNCVKDSRVPVFHQNKNLIVTLTTHQPWLGNQRGLTTW